MVVCGLPSHPPLDFLARAYATELIGETAALLGYPPAPTAVLATTAQLLYQRHASRVPGHSPIRTAGACLLLASQVAPPDATASDGVGASAAPPVQLSTIATVLAHRLAVREGAPDGAATEPLSPPSVRRWVAALAATERRVLATAGCDVAVELPHGVLAVAVNAARSAAEAEAAAEGSGVGGGAGGWAATTDEGGWRALLQLAWAYCTDACRCAGVEAVAPEAVAAAALRRATVALGGGGGGPPQPVAADAADAVGALWGVPVADVAGVERALGWLYALGATRGRLGGAGGDLLVADALRGRGVWGGRGCRGRKPPVGGGRTRATLRLPVPPS
ncbi:hypothetical protein MMPV_002660 [Pyropia vietnamensis]